MQWLAGSTSEGGLRLVCQILGFDRWFFSPVGEIFAVQYEAFSGYLEELKQLASWLWKHCRPFQKPLLWASDPTSNNLEADQHLREFVDPGQHVAGTILKKSCYCRQVETIAVTFNMICKVDLKAKILSFQSTAPTPPH